ncbi:MAG: TRAP transporter small permease subunit [Ferrovibrio sp.]|uniref:TRAP transporter small permease subunit n=1 Tax=Ferrovibrio sp. TaxID=1917215 RepID=UPI0026377E28|nr:TRAP transporter small permease subunit [Ferrovibrio sp.]MCW0234196.1 TRAP transporter small permease subunit [Ferrovibrio sp.]
MPSVIAGFTGAVTAINRAAFYLAISLVYLIVPVMLIDVVARYVFNAPTVWGMELATLLFGPYFLLAGPYVLHLKGHVAMDILRQRLKLRADRMVELVNLPIIIAFCAILLWFSVPAAVDSWNYGETSFSAWNPPIWWTKAAVPLSLVLMLLQGLAEFLRVLFRDPGAMGHRHEEVAL